MKEPLSFQAHQNIIDGLEVYIGKDAFSNDYLSLKFARAKDYWFHVRGDSGSHVILCCHHLTNPPSKDTIKKVASLAAYYSKQRNGGTVPVSYTLAKNVQKPRKASPGTVTIRQEKIVRIKPQSLENILAE